MRTAPASLSGQVRAPSHLRRSLTLAELVVSMSVATLALGGVTSALLIASRATDTATGPAPQTTDARSALDWITADLNHAMSFSEQTATSVTFAVPDRDGDKDYETIRYAWGGSAGNALTREYNAGSQVTIAENVEHFQLSYLVKPLTSIPLEQSAELELMSYSNLISGSLKDYGVDHSHWCAQYFKPSLPTNAVSWNVTRVRFRARQENTPRTLRIQIRPASARQTPTTQVLDEVMVITDTLPVSYSWCDYSFSGTPGLGPLTGACIVISQVSDSTGAKIRYIENGFSMPQNTHWTTTSNASDSWSTPVNNKDMLFYVYGTITIEGPAE